MAKNHEQESEDYLPPLPGKTRAKKLGLPKEIEGYFDSVTSFISDAPIALAILFEQHQEWGHLQNDAHAYVTKQNTHENTKNESGEVYGDYDDFDDEETQPIPVDYEEFLDVSFAQYVKWQNEIEWPENLTVRADFVRIETEELGEKMVVPERFVALFEDLFYQTISDTNSAQHTCADILITDKNNNLIGTSRVVIELFAGSFPNPYAVGVTPALYQKLKGNFLEINRINIDNENSTF